MNFPSITLETPVDVAGAFGAEGFAADANSVAESMREHARSLMTAVPARRLQGLTDDDFIAAMSALEHLGRYVDALRVEAASHALPVLPRFAVSSSGRKRESNWPRPVRRALPDFVSFPMRSNQD